MGLDAGTALALWEHGALRHPVDRALLLCTQADAVGAAELALGARDHALMQLRCAWFGAQLDALVDCPACANTLGFRLDLRELAHGLQSEAPGVVEAAGERWRVPNSHDLAAVAGCTDADTAAQALLARLALDPLAHVLDDAGVAQLEAALDAADPGAHIEFAMVCDGCGHAWGAPFDIATLLWDELVTHARRLAAEVHTLASAYGWSEAQILALSPARRGLYLQQVML